MRIAVYHNLHSGGAKRVVAEQLNRLSRQYQVTLFSLASADHKFASAEPNPAITEVFETPHFLPMARRPFGRFNPILRFINLIELMFLARKQARQIDAQGFDVVLIHPCQITQTPLILFWLRTPSVYYCHELPRGQYERPVPRPHPDEGFFRTIVNKIDFLPGLYSKCVKILDRMAARRATVVLTNSFYNRLNISKAYQRDVSVCHPGVDGKGFSPDPGPRESFVLSVGALTPLKGFDFIIRALGTLEANHRPSLVIISNYQEEGELSYLNGLAGQLGVSIEYRSNLSDKDLRDWYARAGCVAYTPIREPFGLVALEAMASGAPVVCVGEGGVKETVVDDLSGLVIPRDEVAFGAAIDKMLNEPGLADRLGKAARQYVLEKWTWDQHMKLLEDYLLSTAQVYPVVLASSPAKQMLPRNSK